MAKRVLTGPTCAVITIKEAIVVLEKHLPLEQRVNLSRMDDNELVAIQLSIGAWVRDAFGLWQGNDKLMGSIEAFVGREVRSADEASALIVEELERRVRQLE